jgi:mRNA-degrading endonuclease YafQ of YafQ-DinJ toxin-antitoxin module
VRTLVWSAAFVRAFRRLALRQPALRSRVERTLQQLAEDPFQPSLHSHKLKGELAGVWACTVDYDNRILFEFGQNPESGEEEILLLTMGTHDEVY